MEASHPNNSQRLFEIWQAIVTLAREMYFGSDVNGSLKATVLMLASPLFTAFMQAAIQGNQDLSSLHQLWCYAYATYTHTSSGIDVEWRLGCDIVDELYISCEEKQIMKELIKMGLQYLATYDSSKKVYKDVHPWHPLN
jgi:hypothetical protein